MTSPVDTTVKFFTSDMPGAPVLTGQVGSLVALLDACLVNGWGSQTASSVVVADGVATATFPSDHAGFVDSVVLVAGATPSGLNGEQKVTARAANTISWATAEDDGTATGTITVKMAPAGFNIAFTGTNLRAYKSASVQAHGQFLRVADTTTLNARVIGYENMTAISTGTGLFPTTAQLSGGYYWGKSNSADSVANKWELVSDGRIFYYVPHLSNAVYGAGYEGGNPYYFGDAHPRSSAGDPFLTLLGGGTDANALFLGPGTLVDSTSVGSNVVAAREFGGTGTAVFYAVGRPSSLTLSLPNKITGTVDFSTIYARSSASESARGAMPGLYLSEHAGTELLFGGVYSLLTMRGTPSRMLAAQVSPAGVSLSGFRMLAFDIVGPWR